MATSTILLVLEMLHALAQDKVVVWRMQLWLNKRQIRDHQQRAAVLTRCLSDDVQTRFWTIVNSFTVYHRPVCVCDCVCV